MVCSIEAHCFRFGSSDLLLDLENHGATSKIKRIAKYQNKHVKGLDPLFKPWLGREAWKQGSREEYTTCWTVPRRR